MHPLINHTFTAVRKAARYALQAQERIDTLRIDVKGGNELVTEVDMKVQEIILSSLLSHMPDLKVIAEEKSQDFYFEEDYEWAVIIDPIDGTHNFIHRLPFVGISIAFVKKNQRTNKDDIELALVYDIIHDELFHAERGRGAYCNKHRMRVSAKKELSLGMFSVASSLTDLMVKLKDNGGYIRDLGSASLALAYCAAGRLDGCALSEKIKIWDYAAGLLLMQESGGVVNTFAGDPFHIHQSGRFVAANPHLCGQLLRITKE